MVIFTSWLPVPPVVLQLKLPANEKLVFLAGQYIEFLLKDGKRRAFSIANAPHDDGFLQLHVRMIAGGSFTGHVFSGMKEKDILRFQGPYGSFFLRDESGTVLVRPDGARIEPHTTVRFSCGREHAAYYGKGPAGAVADTLHRRHFHEQSIVLRARVFVVGRARERRDAVAAEIAADPDARMFVRCLVLQMLTTISCSREFSPTIIPS